MAKIYISYQRNDRSFVIELANQLKAAGHTLSYDIDELSPGTDWRSALDAGLKTSEVFIVVLSQGTAQSQYVLTEVGAARAYALESGRMLIIPIIIDDIPIPLPIQDIQAIVQPDRKIEEIIPRVEEAVSSFIGRRAASESAAAKVAEKIQNDAADFIEVAITSLDRLEKRDRRLSYIWYSIGFLALLAGIGFAFFGLLAAQKQGVAISFEILTLVALKTIVVIGLLGACAKYAFVLGKSYASESLKSSDRIHAIRFGKFYLKAFGDRTTWSELKEVFQHWNIDRNSSFSVLDASNFDPKFLEQLLDLIKHVSGKKAN